MTNRIYFWFCLILFTPYLPASPQPISIPIRKLSLDTAMAFATPTSQIKRFEPSLLQVPQFFFLAGGVPITAAGTLYGAIGVSGSPKSTTDEACAKAGVNAIQ